MVDRLALRAGPQARDDRLGRADHPETYAASELGHDTFVGSTDWLERPAGEIGLIYCRQPAYPDFTYTSNPEARVALERDGLWCVGDMVISGGVNIYPRRSRRC